MTEIIGEKQWSSVRQLETFELARGGINGNMNEQAKSLADRTEFLKENSATKDDLNAIGQGSFAFDTRAIALVKIVELEIPPNTKIEITNEAEFSGPYQWNGTELKPSDYSPVQIANNFTTQKFLDVTNEIELKSANDPNIICISADAHNNALVYYDKLKEKFVGAGLFDSIFELFSQLKKYEDNNNISVLSDANGKILIGWDKINDKLIGVTETNTQQKSFRYFAEKPTSAEVNHLLSYGESLSIGATAVNILSTSQPYLNTTFDTGPRQDIAATSVIPLVEKFAEMSADGYANNRGETHCSGAANYASLNLVKNGINPDSHVIFASTAGQGGAKIAALARGSSAYSRFLNHITKAKELNSGKTHKINVIPFVIGTNDAAAATSYADFRTKFEEVYSTINADVKAQTAQTNDVVFIVPQISYGAATQPQISKALLDLVNENDKFMLSTPLYHLPYDADKIHLTNVGYKLHGAYIGRAYYQYVKEGRYADYIKPLSAYIEKDKIYIKFDVPRAPLVIDNSTLAATTNSGFKVMSGSTEVIISNVSATNDTVILQLSSTQTTSLTVRYALDYLGNGLNFIGGASGNLRDSTTDTIIIAGIEKSLYHVCPHFELTAQLNKGI